MTSLAPAKLPAALPPLILPKYRHSTLADFMPSIGAHLGIAGCREDVIGLPSADRYVVLLVDGLGWHLVRGAISHLYYLSDLLGEAKPLTCGVPSTTVTSLTSLGTGLTPGQHGMVGFTCRVPETGEILNALTWESDVDPIAFQPRHTFFQAAASGGVAVSSVGPEHFRNSGLTLAALRGARFIPIQGKVGMDQRIELIANAARLGERSLVYSYERQLDHRGHTDGVSSPIWLAELGRIDQMCANLRAALPEDVCLVVTGDHGMLDVPPDRRILLDDEPSLLAGVSAVAGEARFRQLYVDQEPPEAVAERWRDRLASDAWVRTRDEAIDEGWFGPVSADVTDRYGHVLVAMRSDGAILSSAYPQELALVAMHGSLTPAEMLIPVFVD